MGDPTTSQTHNAFSISWRVEVNIRATAENVWCLLTDAKGFPRWNSTVSIIEGHIREGERLRLHVPGTDRGSLVSCCHSSRARSRTSGWCSSATPTI
jgi:uncharacterized protein YndB with AHSA1/START domain